MSLFTAHLTALKGFYVSNVYASAENREQALEQALEVLTTYFDEQVTEFGCSFLISGDNMPEDPEFAQNRADWLSQVKAELSEKLEPIPENVIVAVRS